MILYICIETNSCICACRTLSNGHLLCFYAQSAYITSTPNLILTVMQSLLLWFLFFFSFKEIQYKLECIYFEAFISATDCALLGLANNGSH